MTQSADPFERKLKEIAERLPRDNLKRFIDILQQYQDIRPEQLPPHIFRELNEIIDIGEGKVSSREQPTTSKTESDTYLSQLPDSEKLRIVDNFMNRPDSPIPKEVVPNLPDEMKSDLFKKLVDNGVIKWERVGGR
jgi:hypothetical protein